jgi:hypothetical protein
MVLLHAGDVAVDALRFHWAVFAVGVAALSAALAWIWASGPVQRVVPRVTRAALPRVVAAAVILALLPTVFPYDHLFVAPTHDGDEGEVHASHCHTAPGSCSDAPIPSGPNQLLDSAPWLVAPALLAVLLFGATPLMRGISRRPDVPPPLLLRTS